MFTEELILKLCLVCPLLFAAGVIDGISGGGGIIALPSYLMAGLPPNVAYGCNKMQSCLGTSASLFRYARSGYLDVRAALPTAIAAMLGSFLATRVMLILPNTAIKAMIAVFMIFVITLTLLTSRLRSGTRQKIEGTARNFVICAMIGILLGLYDGFFGPGSSTVAMMLFTLIFGYDIRVGSGNSKLIVVLSNLSALINYIIEGKIRYEIAIPASIFNIGGSYLGAVLATKKGGRLIKRIMIAVVAVLLIQVIFKFI